MSSLPPPRQSAITAVIVIALIVPALGAPVAHPLGENATGVDNASVDGKPDNAECWLPVQLTRQDRTETDAKVIQADNTSLHSSHERELILYPHPIAEAVSAENTTELSITPCYSRDGATTETDNRMRIPLEQITNATVGTLNRTTGEITTAIDTVGYTVVSVINRTSDRIVIPTHRTERPTPTPPESDDTPRDGPDREGRTEPPPSARAPTEEDRPQLTPTPEGDVGPPPTTATPTTVTTATPTLSPIDNELPPTTATPPTPPTVTTATPGTAEPSPTEATITTDQHPGLETETAAPPPNSVRSPSNDSDDGSGVPGGGRPPFEPEPKTGVAVGLGAAAVKILFKHSSTAPETVSRVGGLSTFIRTRLTAVIGSLSRMVVLLRYSRYDDSDPLKHEGRATVSETIEETPGIYLSAISDHTELSLSTLRHHLRVLEGEGLIMSVKVHGKRRFYPADTEQIELTAALGEEPTANVIEALCHLGPATVSELAEELDRDPSTVTHHLQRLDGDDIVCRKRSGRVVVNRLADDVLTYLTEQPEQPPAVSNAD